MCMRWSVALLVLTAAGPVCAQVPHRISYQGRLVDGTNLVNGAVTMAFRLYTAPAGGTAVYGQTGGVTVADGLYATEIGDGTPAFAAAFTNEPLFLETEVNGATLAPREAVRSVAYALRAAGVSSGAITSAMIADGAVGEADLAAGAVTSAKLAVGSVQSNHLAAGSVGAAALQDGAVSDAKLELDYWSLSGNANVTAGSFIGHALTLPIQFRIFGARVMRYQYGMESHSIVGGHGSNAVRDLAFGAVIAGGGRAAHPNRAFDDYAAIGGGLGNTAGIDDANFTNAVSATVAGGEGNRAIQPHAAVGGGYSNLADGAAATVSGGLGNQAFGDHAFVGGGYSNAAVASQASVGGGFANTAGGTYATVGGGYGNRADARSATVGGGEQNLADELHGVVAGGLANRSYPIYGAIGGGRGNLIESDAPDAVIAGGNSNRVSAEGGVIGGGAHNRADEYGVVAGGYSNEVSGGYAVVGGGLQNFASSDAVVGGGFHNAAADNYAVVPGGLNNRAGAIASFAAGSRAYVQGGDVGTFLWSDASSTSRFYSAAINEFGVRASAGLRLALNSPGPGVNERFGRVFRDNTIVAWAKVSADGTTGDNQFGVESATNLSAGYYEIALTAEATNAGQLVMVASPEVDAQPNSAGTMRFATVNQVNATVFHVYINNGSFAPTNHDFTFIATGR